MSEDPCGTLDLLDALAAEPLPAAPPRPRGAGPEVDAICALLLGDPMHALDRERIVVALVEDARRHDGHVDPNRVRAGLTRENADGSSDLTVYPRLLGATYQALAKKGVLEFVGWTTSTDTRGRNAGRPARSYRLTRLPEGTS